jgi:predicted nucleic acid-binding protein
MLSRSKIAQLKEMISGMYVIDMNSLQKQIAIELRQKRKLKTPDAIIAAAAIKKTSRC